MSVIGAIIGGIGAASGLANLGTNIANTVFQRDIANKNFELQQAQFEYEKQLQNRIFDREDSSIQRRMADLQKAGLSPLLAASGDGAGSGTPIATQAPQMDVSGVDYGSISSGLTRALSDATTAFKLVSDMQSEREKLNGLKLDNGLKQAELDNALNFGGALKKAQLDILSETLTGKKNENSQNGVRNDLLMESLKKARFDNKILDNDINNLNVRNALLQLELKDKKLNHEESKHDYLWYREIEKALGIKFPYRNYVPLKFAGETLSGAFDSIVDLFGGKLIKGATSLIEKGIKAAK